MLKKSRQWANLGLMAIKPGTWLWVWRKLVAMVLISAGAFGQQPGTLECPLDFTVLDKFPTVAEQARDTGSQCVILLNGLEMLLAAYLRNTSFFQLPPEVVPACLQGYRAHLIYLGADVNVTRCEDELPSILSRGTDNCQGIQRSSDFATIASQYVSFSSVQQRCAGVLEEANSRQNKNCQACFKQVASLTADLQAFNLSGVKRGCQNYSSMYVAAMINRAGPLDPNTAACMFSIFPISKGSRNLMDIYIALGTVVIALLSFAVALSFYYKHRRRKLAEEKAMVKRNIDLLEGSMRTGEGSIIFTVEEIKAATCNFSREMILGSGAYGNVYKGVLTSGVEVAIKRFKNCSPAGDKDFVHEVEMISSVRHRNLVVLRGCCVASRGVVEGHQRMIIMDYLPNGSLQDVLKPSKPSLDWLTRQRIAIGVARGLDYLHHGLQPAILHRDIKSSNILLDAEYNACVADFGLARFTPEGVTHVSTRAAGTFGYVAPEYTMYGQLTEKSDVYSFGLTKALDGSALIYSYLSLPALACGRTLGGMSETRCVSKALKLSFLLHCSVVAERPTSEKRYAVVATHENGGLELSEDSQSQATSSDMKQITERVLVNPDSGRSGNREGEFVESEAPSTEVKSGGASENVEKNGSISKTFVLPSDVGVGAKIPQADSKGGMRWNMLLSTEALEDAHLNRASSVTDAHVLRRKGRLKEQDGLIEFIISMHSTHSSFQVMEKLERWVREHVEDPKRSTLSRLIPTLGRCYTPLPLVRAFYEYDEFASLSRRRYVPPNFAELRHVLNIAQVHAIAEKLSLITFDADGTIYADGHHIGGDNKMIGLIIKLMQQGVHVAIATAAGYPGNAAKFEDRLAGLLEAFKHLRLPPTITQLFHVMGGECNYLLRVNQDYRLEFVPDEVWMSPDMLEWTEIDVYELLTDAECSLRSAAARLRVPIEIIRKPRAVGAVPLEPTIYEVLEELALTVQVQLMGSRLPFCAFNGGNDVFVDVGNKSVGLRALIKFFNKEPHETLHVGDRFTVSGNDMATRSQCSILWVANPEETAFFTRLLLTDIRLARMQP